MAGTSAIDLYYDPFDVGIDDNPYPVWKRMREEAPLYYNEKHYPQRRTCTYRKRARVGTLARRDRVKRSVGPSSVTPA
jgi:hypothetical protein